MPAVDLVNVGAHPFRHKALQLGFPLIRLLVGDASDWLGIASVINQNMVEILRDNARPEAGEVYGAMDMPWAKLVGQIAQAYGK